jgi:hypothetical protein
MSLAFLSNNGNSNNSYVYFSEIRVFSIDDDISYARAFRMYNSIYLDNFDNLVNYYPIVNNYLYYGYDMPLLNVSLSSLSTFITYDV